MSGKNIRNSKPNYKKGVRKKLAYMLLVNGALPSKALPLLYDNSETAYRKLKDMEREGLVVINKYQDTWMITFKAFTKELGDELSKAFGDEVVEIYEAYGREAAKRAKYNPKSTVKVKTSSKAETYTIPTLEENDDEWGYEEYKDSKPLEKKKKSDNAKRSAMRRVIRNGETLMFVDGIPLNYIIGEKPDLMYPEDADLTGTYYTPYELNTAALSYSEGKSAYKKTYKFQGARHNGLIISEGGSYVIYNSSKWGMQMNKGFEQNLASFTNSVLQNHNLPELDGCIRLVGNDRILLSLMEKKTIKVGSHIERNYPEWIHSIEDYYKHVYVLPIDIQGQILASIMCTPTWKEDIGKVFFEGLKHGHEACKIELHIEEIKNKHNDGYMLYYTDKQGSRVDHRAVSLHFFIPDIKKLRDFVETIIKNGSFDKNGNFEADEIYEIYCFDFQKPVLMTYAGKYVTIKSVKFSKFYEVYRNPPAGLFERNENGT